MSSYKLTLFQTHKLPTSSLPSSLLHIEMAKMLALVLFLLLQVSSFTALGEEVKTLPPTYPPHTSPPLHPPTKSPVHPPAHPPHHHHHHHHHSPAPSPAPVHPPSSPPTPVPTLPPKHHHYPPAPVHPPSSPPTHTPPVPTLPPKHHHYPPSPAPVKPPVPTLPPKHHHYPPAPVHPPPSPPTHTPPVPTLPPKHHHYPPSPAPVKPPVHPPVRPPVHPPVPAHPPLHPTPVPRSFVAIQGVVFLKSCKYAGVDTLLGATPLLGGIVKLQCNNTKYKLVLKKETDKNGYFFIEAPKSITTYGAHKCNVVLVTAPKGLKPSNLHGGVTGAVLRPEKPFVSKGLPFMLYTVGPLAFEPTCPH